MTGVTSTSQTTISGGAEIPWRDKQEKCPPTAFYRIRLGRSNSLLRPDRELLRLTGHSKQESSNFLSGIKTVTNTQSNEKDEEKVLSHTRKTIAKTLKPIEAIDVEDYYEK
jgi:hypothetical protein